MTDNSIRLSLVNNVEELQRIFATVEDFAEKEDWSPALIFKANLVLEEFCLNVINYAYDEAEQSFDLYVTSNADDITIDVVDSGLPFNPLEDSNAPKTEAPIEERDIGGLGIHLVKELVKDFKYSRENNKNHSTMVISKSD